MQNNTATNITPEQEREQTLVEQAQTISRDYFREGLNCAECVMRTFMQLFPTGLPDEAVALASGFGGGIGQTKNICGAVSGAVMALGSVKGRSNPMQQPTVPERAKELRQNVYPIFADMLHELEQEFGTVQCSEMCRAYTDFDGKERKRNCMQIVATCAAAATKYAEA